MCVHAMGSLDDKEQHRVAKTLRKSFGDAAVVTLPPPLRRSELKVRDHGILAFSVFQDDTSLRYHRFSYRRKIERDGRVHSCLDKNLQYM